jgi:hypothetical protein
MPQTNGVDAKPPANASTGAMPPPLSDEQASMPSPPPPLPAGMPPDVASDGASGDVMGPQDGFGFDPSEMAPGVSNDGNGAGGGAMAAHQRSHQHTQVFSEGGDSVVRLHQTNIVTIRANGDVSLSSGGWRTHQTLKGINMSLKTFVPGLQVVSDGHVAEGSWRVTNGRDWSSPFYDGVIVPGAGPQNLAAQAAQMPGLFEQMSVNVAADEPRFVSGKGGKGGHGGKPNTAPARRASAVPSAAMAPLVAPLAVPLAAARSRFNQRSHTRR